MATKLLEIVFFDMKFVSQNLGHGVYPDSQILALEDRIAQLTIWHYTQCSQVDFHSLFLCMIKVRLPSTAMSTVLFRALTSEMDSKFLIDLKQSLCIPSLYQMRPLLKIAGMLTFKLDKLREFIVKDFPFETVQEEMQILCEVWSDIVTKNLKMLTQDLYSVGSLVYQGLHNFKFECRDDSISASLYNELNLY